MPNWYYDKADLKRTPSNLDNLDYETEQRYRREGARFIINVGTTMGLRYDTMATGVVYFHRFYMSHSFRTFPRYVTACCCLFLAGKVEETPKKCKDIIKTARNLLTDKSFAQFGEDPKEEVMTLERILLQTIKFDLQVDHPYSYLLKYAKALRGDKTKVQKLVQMAWTFVNDSLCTTLCLQWEPEIIAIALMYLASKLSKFEVLDWSGRTSKQSRWWDMFVEDMTVELLEGDTTNVYGLGVSFWPFLDVHCVADICHQVLDLYSTPISNTPKDSPPPSPPLSTVKGRPPTPLPTAVKPASPVKGEALLPAASPAAPALTAIPAANVAPLPAPTPIPTLHPPAATPVVIVGHPIPCLEEGIPVVKPPLPPPPPAKILLPVAEALAKAAATAQPALVSPIQSITPGKFNYPASTSKPTTPTPPHLTPAAKEEPYSYVPPPPLQPPPGPPFQPPVFRDSPKEAYGSATGSYRQPSQYYAGSEQQPPPPPPPSQYYSGQEDNKPYYGSSGNGSYPPGPSGRPYPDAYGGAPPPPPPPSQGIPVRPPFVQGPPGHPPPGPAPPGPGPSGHGPPGHGPPGHAPRGHAPQSHPPQGIVPPGHGPPGHIPQGHGPPGHGPPGHIPPVQPPQAHGPQHPPPPPPPPSHAGHLPPPIRGPQAHPPGPYEDKPRPYPGGAPFPPGPRQPPNPADAQYHYGHEPTTPTHAAATGIPTVRITGRY